MRYSYYSIRTDVRTFENPLDMYGHCRKCGCHLVVLPDDRRYGYCFDCLDHTLINRKLEIETGRSFTIPHENGYSLH